MKLYPARSTVIFQQWENGAPIYDLSGHTGPEDARGFEIILRFAEKPTKKSIEDLQAAFRLAIESDVRIRLARVKAKEGQV